MKPGYLFIVIFMVSMLVACSPPWWKISFAEQVEKSPSEQCLNNVAGQFKGVNRVQRVFYDQSDKSGGQLHIELETNFGVVNLFIIDSAKQIHADIIGQGSHPPQRIEEQAPNFLKGLLSDIKQMCGTSES